mgnify:CR=1 FL=1
MKQQLTRILTLFLAITTIIVVIVTFMTYKRKHTSSVPGPSPDVPTPESIEDVQDLV